MIDVKRTAHAQQKRRTVADGPVEAGTHAVMRHSRTSPKKMKFTCWRESRAAALDEAQRLAAKLAGESAGQDVCFYVLQVVDRVGIIDGKLVG